MHIDTNLNQILLQEQENLSRRTPYTNTLNQNVLITPPPSEDDLARIEQAQRLAPKDIVEFQGIEIDLDDLDALNNDEDSDAQDNTLDIRTLTPREMVDFSLNLYIDGALSFDEYSMMAFQVELHPGFDKTIGALTGERPEPDRPRDYIQEWEERYSFEQRYPSDSPATLQKIERILGVLNYLNQPDTDLNA